MTGLVIVAAAALRDANGRVLVQRRPPGKSLAGLWEFPGGKLEPFESPELALARELAEELGIKVFPADLSPLTFASVKQGGVHLLLLLYLVQQWRGVPEAHHATAVRWEFPETLYALDMPPADGPLVAALIAAR